MADEKPELYILQIKAFLNLYKDRDRANLPSLPMDGTTIIGGEIDPYKTSAIEAAKKKNKTPDPVLQRSLSAKELLAHFNERLKTDEDFATDVIRHAIAATEKQPPDQNMVNAAQVLFNMLETGAPDLASTGVVDTQTKEMAAKLKTKLPAETQTVSAPAPSTPLSQQGATSPPPAVAPVSSPAAPPAATPPAPANSSATAPSVPPSVQVENEAELKEDKHRKATITFFYPDILKPTSAASFTATDDPQNPFKLEYRHIKNNPPYPGKNLVAAIYNDSKSDKPGLDMFAYDFIESNQGKSGVKITPDSFGKSAQTLIDKARNSDDYASRAFYASLALSAPRVVQSMNAANIEAKDRASIVTKANEIKSQASEAFAEVLNKIGADVAKP